MKKNLTFALFFIAFLANAQEVTFVTDNDRETTDYYLLKSHSYTYIKNNEISLFWNKDKIEKQNSLAGANFKDPFLGNIHHFDERSPLRRLAFYKNTQYLVLLDNHLSEVGRLSLLEKFPELTAVYAALTTKAGIWLFDENSNRWCILNSFNDQPKMVSNPIVNYQYLTSDGNYAYWQNNTKVYGIDMYGKLIKEHILPENAQMLAINQNKIVYQLNNNVFLFNTENNEKQKLEEISEPVEKAIFGAEFLIIFTNDKIYTYHIKF